MIFVSIVEDDSVIRNNLADLINSIEGYKCIGSYSGCESLINEIEDNLPDVILMDIDLPGISGIEGMILIKDKFPSVDIVMLTVHEDAELVFKAIKSGACGYLDKSAPEKKIMESIKEVYNGGAPMTTRIAKMVVSSFQSKTEESDLTEREKDVLNLLCGGNAYKEIGEQLFISVGTVRHHIKNIYEKLHVHSKSQAVAKAIKERLV
ncbi:MAG: DNA-binding response regulator [Ignavibacteria bacterium GWB2_35_6b]|nr:MAG: DNA-binding response regulator [Ignavibacteria bacterium GWB2_35_6b]